METSSNLRLVIGNKHLGIRIRSRRKIGGQKIILGASREIGARAVKTQARSLSRCLSELPNSLRSRMPGQATFQRNGNWHATTGVDRSVGVQKFRTSGGPISFSFRRTKVGALGTKEFEALVPKIRFPWAGHPSTGSPRVFVVRRRSESNATRSEYCDAR